MLPIGKISYERITIIKTLPCTYCQQPTQVNEYRPVTRVYHSECYFKAKEEYDDVNEFKGKVNIDSYFFSKPNKRSLR